MAPMTCADFQARLGAWHDAEMPPQEYAALEAHLRDCAECTAQVGKLRAISSLIRDHAPMMDGAPNSLRRRIELTLAQADDPTAGSDPAATQNPAGPRRSRLWVNAGAALVLVLTAVAVYYPDSRDSVLTADHLAHIGQPIAAFSIDALRPALAQPGVEEIPIKDFKDQGYALVNGRKVQIGDVAGGALLYRANGHPISLYITPTPERTETKPSYSKALGMTVVRWRDDGRDYAVVSDLPQQQLEKFVTLACESL